MDFLALANQRYSMRKFDSRPVEPEVLNQILESARIAPIATTHMMLDATSLGLGTTWVAAFNPEAAREAYQVPENLEIVALLPLGYPASDVEPAPKHFEREPMEHMVSWHRF